jgi:methylmalonyl-CoA mutase N-terminal domain/subunit
LERKEKFIVGVNEFVDKNEKIDIPILQISPEVEKAQKERLYSLKQKRDKKKVEESLKAIGYAAVHEKNLMPVLIKAAENYVTLGEMVNELKKYFGVYQEKAAF